jgi:2-polyprenyl-3-methyl-5-hydroxy-6-metoxy-1,4-benzoquinol methylase
MNTHQSAGDDVRCNFCGAHDAVPLVPSTLSETQSEIRSAGAYNAFACTSSGYGEHGLIVRCQHCGLVYAAPRPETREVLELYSAVQDPLYVAERAGRILTFEHHLKPMERFTGPAAGRRLLDVGAYTGVFVEISARHGWDAWGVEPSAWAVGEAQRDGLQMVLGTLENAKLPDASYAVVTMWDVIEHVADPFSTLRAAWHVLEPGGSLVVHTMDLDSPFAKFMGRRWPWFMEMHLYYFTRKTLRAMLEKAGFSVIWMGAQGRYLQAGYLTSRVTALFPPLGRPLEWMVGKARLRDLPLRVNLGDLFTVYARKRQP